MTLRRDESTRAPDTQVLDNPAWAALAGPQSRLGEVRAKAARFHPDVSPFAALADPADPQSWQDLAALTGPGSTTAVIATTGVPAGWTVLGQGSGVQMLGEGLEVAPDSEVLPLTAADVPAMLELVKQTNPGPFRLRTIEMGNYLGIRENSQLVAMAGERLKPPGWTEISAVCTAATHRGKGLATRLIRAVGHGVRQRGDVPFLHAAASNINAIRLYEQLGFVVRRRPEFVFLRTPDA